MQLGVFFNHFLSQKMKNKKLHIEVEDAEKNPYGWKFYKESFGGLRKQLLDPNVSLGKNGIGENGLIIAKRVTELSETNIG